MSLWKNTKASYSHIPYTWRHKMAVIKLEKKFTGRNTVRIFLHDTDKLITYVFLPFLTLHQHKELHRKLNKHHHYYEIEKLSEEVLREIVLDWESAHYTKSDKQETARQYCLRARPYLYPYLSKYFDKWRI